MFSVFVLNNSRKTCRINSWLELFFFFFFFLLLHRRFFHGSFFKFSRKSADKTPLNPFFWNMQTFIVRWILCLCIKWFYDNCPQGKLPPNLLSLTLNQTLTLTRGQFSSGTIVRTPYKIDCLLKIGIIWKKDLLKRHELMKIWIQFMEKFLIFCESLGFPGIKILHQIATFRFSRNYVPLKLTKLIFTD